LLAWASAVGCGGSQDASVSDASTGTDATQPTVLGPSDPDPCNASKVFEQRVIANFDDSSGLAGPYGTYVSFDATGTLFQSGQPVMGIDSAEAIADGGPRQCLTGYSATSGDRLPTKRCGTDSTALHLFATGDVDAGAQDAGLTGWGMNVGIDLRQNCTCPAPPTPCPQVTHPELGCQTATNQTGGSCSPMGAPCFFDASGYTGISFWAMLGPQSTASVALATVSDPNTGGQLGGTYPFNDLICGDPPCVAGQAQMHSGLALCDPFGKAIGLVDHWEFYAIPFDEMRQKGYGLPESKLDVAHVLAFKLSLGKGVWDVWLDDIAFYRPKGD
jgi:hypothetical protein